MKKKICLILIAAILFVFIVGSQCFASSSQYGFYYDGAYRFLSEELISKYPYILILKFNDYFYLLCSSKIMGYSDTFLSPSAIINDGNTGFIYYSVFSSLNNLSNITDLNESFNSHSSLPAKASELEYIYSTFNFTYFDFNTSTCSDVPVVFNNSSSVYTFVSDLPEAYQNSGLGGVLNEVITLLPVCLVVIIGFIGIRKGIAFIRSILRKS